VTSAFVHPAVLFSTYINNGYSFSQFAAALEDVPHNIVHQTLGSIFSTMASPDGKKKKIKFFKRLVLIFCP